MVLWQREDTEIWCWAVVPCAVSALAESATAGPSGQPHIPLHSIVALLCGAGREFEQCGEDGSHKLTVPVTDTVASRALHSSALSLICKSS